MSGTSNDWANLLDEHVPEYEREDAAGHKGPHIMLDIRCKNINPHLVYTDPAIDIQFDFAFIVCSRSTYNA